jgi:hypothetical protein
MQDYVCQLEHNSNSRRVITAQDPAGAVSRFCEQVKPPDGAVVICRNQAGDAVSFGVRQIISYSVSEI